MLADFKLISADLDKLIGTQSNKEKALCQKFILAWHSDTESVKNFVLTNEVGFISETLCNI